MCGIPMMPETVPDAVRGKKLTFEQALLHIGGFDNLVDDDGSRAIHASAKEYLWKYRDKVTHCTACRATIDGFVGQHGKLYACPVCGARCELRHEARGHRWLFDHFMLYQWRRSQIDTEAVTLTATYIWRDSCSDHYPMPHEAPLHIEPKALYVFRPGRAVTVYKDTGWREPDWHAVNSIKPEHTKHGYNMEIVVVGFRQAIMGTRIGATFDTLREVSGRWDTLELQAVANCARRPWLEYLAKCGQERLAAELMRQDTISREILPNRRAKKPAQLLGLTEGQWFEIRREGFKLDTGTLSLLHKLERIHDRPVKVAEAMAVYNKAHAYNMELLLPGDAHYYSEQTIADMIEKLPEKLRRKITRRILHDLANAREWRDYYRQLAELGEVECEIQHDRYMQAKYRFIEPNTALLLPRDMSEMHQRMTDRMNALRVEAKARELAAKQEGLRKRLPELREQYLFHAAGLVLRPFDSVREVLNEGQVLGICIGSYASGYAEGSKIICCLRREEEPDEPWRAVEFSTVTGKMVQDRGRRNDAGGIPDGVKIQLRLFWSAWNRAQAKKRKRERRIAS